MTGPTAGVSPAAPFLPVPGGFARTILDTAAALVVVLDPAGRVVYLNAACERLVGFTLDEVRGQVLWPFVLLPDEQQGVEAVFARLVAGDFPTRHENHWQTRSGEQQLIMWTNTALLSADGAVEFVVGTGVNVTAERRAEQARAHSEARFRALFDNFPDGVVLIDPHDPAVPWRIVDCNDAFCRMNGYGREQLLGQSIDLLHDTALMAGHGPRLLEWIRQERHALGEGLHRRQDGSTFPIETSSSLVELDGLELVLGMDRDVSERKRTEQKLQELRDRLDYEARHDSLTGLPNRALLADRLELELARATRSGQGVAVMFIDLDDFKRVNDTLGHAAGDRLLREVARRLRAAVRPGDTVARMSGDEFVVVVPELQGEHPAARVARRLQRALALPFDLGGQSVTLRCSVGISLRPQDGAQVDQLLQQADMAMYRAKAAGKNDLCFFSPAMNLEALERQRIETRLRQALDSNGFHLHYQPQFEILSGRLVGLEALLRWTDAELGSVSPARFIPVAEDSGLIVPLGAWVLDEACRQVAAWGLEVPVAVNVSPTQLMRGDFTETVRAALQSHGLRGSALKLELTERLVVRDPGLAGRRLARLQGLGVQLSMDDFGAGESAISSLLALPVDELKLDRSLMAGLGHTPESQRVVGALLALARGLNLPVVAEGVETPEQLAALRSLGCAAVQGYLTGRPAAPAALAALLGAASPSA